MNTPTSNSEYLLLFRGTHWDQNLSPEEIQRVMNQWMAWFERHTKAGTVKAGQPLHREGKIISGKNGSTVSDGPFAESKEAIAGYFLLQVDDFEAALQIARECPALPYGMSVEVRPVADTCGVRLRLQERLAEAST